MAEAKAVQRAANIGAMNAHIAPRQLNAQFIQRQIAVRRRAFTQPFAMPFQLTGSAMALPFRRKRARLAFQNHHVVYKSRRYPKMRRRKPMAVTFLNKSDNALTQLNRMWLAQKTLLVKNKGNQSSLQNEIMNLIKGDTL